MHTNAYKGGGGGDLNMTKNTHFVCRFIENAMSFYGLHKMKTNLLKTNLSLHMNGF